MDSGKKDAGTSPVLAWTVGNASSADAGKATAGAQTEDGSNNEKGSSSAAAESTTRSLPSASPALARAPSRRKKTTFSGLANQGATCYMNSLLQSLYMTPEFRRVLFSWRYDKDKDDEPEDCIPYQLQLLFAQLQSTEQRAVSTTALTTSFGWTGRESFQQHDVQELARVLFDALERSLSGTASSQLVSVCLSVD